MPRSVDIPGVEILAPITESHAGILSPEAIDFIVDQQRTFNVPRKELLHAREERQKRLDAGERPNFLEESRSIRESEWTVAPMPVDIIDRRVEITGPVDRKMIINALNSGARIFMADFEDTSTPTWNNLMESHVEARLWNGVFIRARKESACRRGPFEAPCGSKPSWQALKWRRFSTSCATTRRG